MRTLRFFHETLSEGMVKLSYDESHHARNVLRVSCHQPVELFDGRGRIAHATVQDVTDRHVSVNVNKVHVATRPNGVRLTLLTALPRNPRQSVLFEKATELGVERVVPILFDRSTVVPRSTALKKWRRTCIEAAKQCGSAYLPEIAVPITLEESLAQSSSACARWVASPRTSARLLVDALGDPDLERDLSVWVGPEGGFAPREHELFERHCVIPVRLGAHILRIETANLVVAAACMYSHRQADRR